MEDERSFRFFLIKLPRLLFPYFPSPFLIIDTRYIRAGVSSDVKPYGPFRLPFRSFFSPVRDVSVEDAPRKPRRNLTGKNRRFVCGLILAPPFSVAICVCCPVKIYQLFGDFWYALLSFCRIDICMDKSAWKISQHRRFFIYLSGLKRITELTNCFDNRFTRVLHRYFRHYLFVCCTAMSYV